MPAAVFLDHVTVVSDDFDADRALYDAFAAALGWTATVEYTDPEEEDDDTQTVAAIGYAAADRSPSLWLVAGHPATSGGHVAFAVADRATVTDVHRAVADVHGRVVQAPRDWEERQLGYFGTQVADRNGNVLEVLHRT